MVCLTNGFSRIDCETLELDWLSFDPNFLGALVDEPQSLRRSWKSESPTYCRRASADSCRLSENHW